MQILDPGHRFVLNNLDATVEIEEVQFLQFVKRAGPKYPGNEGTHPGTTLQEVFRACIKRLQYLQRQEMCPENQFIMTGLRHFIWLLEWRAARRHKRELKMSNFLFIEELPTCPKCGHIGCEGGCHAGA